MTSHDLLLGQGFPSFTNAFHFYIRVNHSATMYICIFEMIAIALNHLGTIVVVIVWFLDLQLPMQSVPITTKVVSSNLCHSEMY